MLAGIEVFVLSPRLKCPPRLPSPCCPVAGETRASWSEADPCSGSWTSGLATASCWSCWWCDPWSSSLRQYTIILYMARWLVLVSVTWGEKWDGITRYTGLQYPPSIPTSRGLENKNISEKKNNVELRAGSPAWPASEAELLEIPSVEEVTVPLPRLPTLHCVTNQQH